MWFPFLKLKKIRLVTVSRVCMDYCKLNAWSEKEYFIMLFIHHILDRLSGNGGIVFYIDIWLQYDLQSCGGLT